MVGSGLGFTFRTQVLAEFILFIQVDQPDSAELFIQRLDLIKGLG